MDWKLIFQSGLIVFWGIRLGDSIIDGYDTQKVKNDLPNTLIFIMSAIITSIVYVVFTGIFGLIAYGVSNLIGIV